MDVDTVTSPIAFSPARQLIKTTVPVDLTLKSRSVACLYGIELLFTKQTCLCFLCTFLRSNVDHNVDMFHLVRPRDLKLIRKIEGGEELHTPEVIYETYR